MLKKLSISLLLLSNNFIIISNEDCLDNSKHTNTCDGYDYKDYHKVKCYCPCDRYPQLFERGKCTKCGHYRAPKPLFKIINKKTNSILIE
ncbi:hypothetical protein [Candidatus Babela massiliensis]|uniref:Uncharacterized protein n=1 Tax=Candidatus Babela massiliensis TaxID=673862 RepID=V6DKM6_9BACT|nr:hypothetical protein [Candidatus Babela massiliensis]CDK31061.1 hypothetical protein BABL1_gene_773 [Candidatus Babela massiliensis]